ncbi:TlpA family protein disulfide reductase [Actinocrispum wychmicini]|uniref:Thioredoxin n=1 Tax=Actinocrispum wychmicini TaxID=1213861 RepID=A0A4R2K091_9PSEU|nr:thioredoxin family protein [Actinocrispum wychmicini]TCO65057.1 thioredoxin [Actinocrispum wychmicini]
MTQVLVLVGTLAVATAFGLFWRARQGQVRAARRSALPDPLLDLVDPASPVTLLQISTTFCAPCRQTRVLLSDLAAKTSGLRHVDYDVTEHPEVATSLGVLRTPTTLAVDAQGVEIMRVGGVPKRDTLLAALRPHLP